MEGISERESGVGLKHYSAHLIKNSRWIEGLKTIHKIHPYYKEERQKNSEYLMLLFHDQMFEIVTESIE
ncbi:hypothetical protein CH371_17330 [Leptospira wolffii]|uniref:Uncharacterized protein n=1 Tax=Leptospira wolffii TaxID=409998 RepID=A0A2M9Z7X5_9LEPT|nr:hypothetical protein CH371_17330 [Leptospira wolffii]